jgi:predicted TIM-barrel fold metal-dependent hydrolase
MKRTLLAMVFLGVLTASVQAQDPDLVRYLDSIRAIDNHSHITALDRDHDKGYDQLRCDVLPPTVGLPAANFRFNPDQQWAYKTLYGFDAKTGSEAEIKSIIALELASRKEHGAGFYSWVMEKAGLETAFANRTSMPPEMKAPQIRWVPYEDAILFPMNNSAAKAVNPDRRALYGMAEDLLHAYLRDAGFSAIPATLDSYVEKMVRATLQRQKSSGAVAVKFEAAYLRALDFAPASRAEASRVYAKYAAGNPISTTSPAMAEYKALQDYLFKQIALEAGRLGLVVHIHTGSGCGEFFDDSGADAMMLSPMLNDPDLRKTNFVVLHGNPPRERSVSALIIKPNVYVDMSVLEFYWSPTELARILRPWLEVMPEHVLFGSDAGPFGAGLDWEETILIASRNARRALAIVLSDMVRDGTVTQDRAKEIAQRVLRGNAEQLYGIK